MSFPLPPGLSGLLTDAREFLAAVRFARPDLLWLLLLLPLFVLVNRYALTRRKRATAALGRPAALAGLQTRPRRGRNWTGIAYPLAWVALVFGLAGPRWGKSDEPGIAVGRDLVIVIDLSRSMTADDMAGNKRRWEAAQAGALNLMDAIAQRGGHRVAVVVFAAKPKLLVPLTTDYDHARAVIEDVNGQLPPPQCRPGADPNVVSGTRIGLALKLAVESHDPRFPGAQDVILLSDGDDPGDDSEWQVGVNAARKAEIPVHAVGVGDPARPSHVVLGEELIATRLDEKTLREIAAGTHGQYLPARQEVPRLGEFFRTQVEPNPTRQVSDEAIPQPKERYAWFLAPALLLFAVGWLRGS